MKRSAKRFHQQMNLPLLVRDLPIVSGDQQKELTLTLVEILINAAQATLDAPGHGGDDDSSETDA